MVVAGLPVNVFSDPSSGDRAEVRSDSVVVMFLLHGRTGSARRMETYVTDIFEEIRARRGAYAGAQSEVQDLLIVTIVSSDAWLIVYMRAECMRLAHGCAFRTKETTGSAWSTSGRTWDGSPTRTRTTSDTREYRPR